MMGATEMARRVSRSLLPRDMYLRCASRYGTAVSMLRLGPALHHRLRSASEAPADSAEVMLQPPGVAHPVLVRPGTTDALVFDNNLVRRAYACVELRRPPRFIIDAGANVGYASVYFLSTFPEARVVALEPEPGNAAVARRNLAPYGDRAVVLKCGLWPRSGRLRVRPAERADSVQVEEAVEGEPWDCYAFDPLALLARFEQRRIDLLKCDIEGAEKQVFAVNSDFWLERTACIVAEIHGEAASRVVYAATARHGFRGRRHRDLHVFQRPGGEAW
jgi:FkbM family methyltransferase